MSNKTDQELLENESVKKFMVKETKKHDQELKNLKPIALDYAREFLAKES